MVKAQKFVYKQPFVGEPKVTDFQLVEEELPELKDNGELIIVQSFSSPLSNQRSIPFQRSW